MSTALDDAVVDIVRNAHAGDPTAQYVAGLLYEIGHGVERNPHKALRWYTAAAAQHEAKAQFAMGFLLESGSLGHVDVAAAAACYSHAAANGHHGALQRLGRMDARVRGRPARAGMLQWSNAPRVAQFGRNHASG